MKQYKPKTFNLPKINGISEEQIKVHLGLYEAYVKHTNLIDELLNSEIAPYAKSEMRRRRGFEFNGMRNHEYYFSSIEDGANEMISGELEKQIQNIGGSKKAKEMVKEVASTMRGSGWSMLMYDSLNDNIFAHWVTDQELGQTTGLKPIIALDMWEHAYMVDYKPSDKGKYIDAYLSAINWKKVSEMFNG